MAQTPYIGSKISLISKLDIRYEGILYSVNSEESTIALSKVRSFGTEDRPTPHHVPARDETYEYIIFKASDIKDLIVCEAPKPPAPAQISGLAYDPAIISVTQHSMKQEQPSGTSSPLESPAQQSISLPNYSQAATRGQNAAEAMAAALPPPNRYMKSLSGQQPTQQVMSGSFRQGAAQSIGQNRQAPSLEQTNQWEQASRSNKQGDESNKFQPDGSRRQSYNNNRGYSGSFHSHQNRPLQQQHPGNNGSHQPGQRRVGPQNRLKFDNDFDFEKANEQFQEQLGDTIANLAKVNVGSEKSSVKGDEEVGQSDGNSSPTMPDLNGESFYNKNTSFFDTISCEAQEKEEGKNTRPNWKKERMTNQETFGHSAVRSMNYRRGGRGYGGGHRNYSSNPQQGYNNSGGQQQKYYNNNNNNSGGYRGGRGGYHNYNNRGSRGGFGQNYHQNNHHYQSQRAEL